MKKPKTICVKCIHMCTVENYHGYYCKVYRQTPSYSVVSGINTNCSYAKCVDKNNGNCFKYEKAKK